MRVLIHFALWSLRLAPPETQTSHAERECLTRHASGKRRLVEIGTWHGVTACCLRRVMAPDGVLICVDPFPPGRFRFSAQRVIAYIELSRITNGTLRWMRVTGAEAGRTYSAANNPRVDFLFIDGDHSYEAIREDWETWSPLVAAGGIVALHDSRSSPSRRIDSAGSVAYTREVIARDHRFCTIDTVESLTVLARR